MCIRKSLIKIFCFFIPILYLSLTIISCSTSKKVKYFQDIPDSGQIKTIAKAEYKELVIQPGDILNIAIKTIDPSSTTMVNSSNIPSGASSLSPGGAGTGGMLSALSNGGDTQPQSGLLVDKDGNIEIPIIGKLKASGYTTFQLKDTIYNHAIKYFKDPTVTVRFANFTVSVMGEVLKPGQYIMPGEKESILDAIAMAGDLTIFGVRENVLLLRDNSDGTKTAYRVNLKKSDIISAPYYYLHQNDMIYVEPRKAKSDATDASQSKYISIATAVISLIIILATRVR